MFRLIKLAMVALAGYAIYELYQGMAGRTGGEYGGRNRGGGDLDRAASGNGGRMQTLTGEGIGEELQTLDRSGLSATHRVGRGVIAT